MEGMNCSNCPTALLESVAKLLWRSVLYCDLKPPSVVPAVLKIVDIAGLIRGAAEGAGLGNAFLSHIAAVE